MSSAAQAPPHNHGGGCPTQRPTTPAVEPRSKGLLLSRRLEILGVRLSRDIERPLCPIDHGRLAPHPGGQTREPLPQPTLQGRIPHPDPAYRRSAALHLTAVDPKPCERIGACPLSTGVWAQRRVPQRRQCGMAFLARSRPTSLTGGSRASCQSVCQSTGEDQADSGGPGGPTHPV